jgi:hypothetical protein
MAAIKFARISKGEGKKWNMTKPDGTVESFETAELAAAACDTINTPIEVALAQAEAEASAPVSISVTGRKQFQVRGSRNVGGDDVGGAYPLINATGKQMDLLIAHWPSIVARYEAAKGTVVARWQDLPKSEKAAKA